MERGMKVWGSKQGERESNQHPSAGKNTNTSMRYSFFTTNPHYYLLPTPSSAPPKQNTYTLPASSAVPGPQQKVPGVPAALAAAWRRLRSNLCWFVIFWGVV